MARSKKITPELIEKAGELAKSGFSHKQIYEALDISSAAFYRKSELVETVKEKQAELRTEVAESLLANATGGDTTSLIFLSKRLGLFQTADYKKGKLKTAEDAVAEYEKLYHSAVDGTAPLEYINTVTKILNDFVGSYDKVDLERRIIELEKKDEQK